MSPRSVRRHMLFLDLMIFMATGRARETHVPPDPGPSSRVAGRARRGVPAAGRRDGERMGEWRGAPRPAPWRDRACRVRRDTVGRRLSRLGRLRHAGGARSRRRCRWAVRLSSEYLSLGYNIYNIYSFYFYGTDWDSTFFFQPADLFYHKRLRAFIRVCESFSVY